MINTRPNIAGRIYRSDSSDDENEEEKKGPLLVLSNKIVLPEQITSPAVGLTKVENLTSVKLKYGSNASSKKSQKQNESKQSDSRASHRNNWIENRVEEDEVVISESNQQNNRWND